MGNYRGYKQELVHKTFSLRMYEGAICNCYGVSMKRIHIEVKKFGENYDL